MGDINYGHISDIEETLRKYNLTYKNCIITVINGVIDVRSIDDRYVISVDKGNVEVYPTVIYNEMVIEENF